MSTQEEKINKLESKVNQLETKLVSIEKDLKLYKNIVTQLDNDYQNRMKIKRETGSYP